SSAKGAGIDFAFMKATENVNFVDPQFAANWSGAGANGVVRGAYHFFRPAVDAVMQADYFVQHAGVPGPGDLPPTLDLEVLDGLSGSTVAAGALAWLQRVQQTTGRTPIVYTSSSFLSTLGNPSGFGGYTLWVANWQTTCPSIPTPSWSDWTFWQNSSTGTVAGIPATAVDLDEFNGSLSDLQNFVNPSQVSVDLAGAGPADLAGATASTDLAGASSSSDLAGASSSTDLAGATMSTDLAGGGGNNGGGGHVDAKSGCSCQLGGRARAPMPLAPFAIIALVGLARVRRFRDTVVPRGARRRLAGPRG
ncbi:MAG TPA: GH25 family lysozyme, partial [Polyangia bacterium]|nr:GH25 family lysozyme [Polyangia bacterium]